MGNGHSFPPDDGHTRSIRDPNRGSAAQAKISRALLATRENTSCVFSKRSWKDARCRSALLFIDGPGEEWHVLDSFLYVKRSLLSAPDQAGHPSVGPHASRESCGPPQEAGQAAVPWINTESFTEQRSQTPRAGEPVNSRSSDLPC
jgi:hypothetical protein